MKRRTFIQQITAAGLAAPLILPRLSLAQSPNGKLQHASIGVGGMMGGQDLDSLRQSNQIEIVAICDIDEKFLKEAAEKVPNARRYRDFREMLESEGDKIDSVNVTVPDHMHAPITMSAINKGKHVYCQKPLTHEVYEARQVTLAARRAGVTTQMGIQVHSHVAYRMAVQMIQDGAIGKVKEWHSWLQPDTWPKDGRPPGSDPVPPNVRWDLWIGVAPFRPYKADIYHPINWRGWQDFGSGSLGDMACHIFDPVFTALEIGAPSTIKAEISSNNHENWPEWQVIEYEFPGTKYTASGTIKGWWHDGGKMPPEQFAPILNSRKQLPRGGSLIVGEEGTMFLPHVEGPQLFPAEKFKNYPRPRLESVDHYSQWIEACLGQNKASAPFDYAGPLSEAVQLGNVAVRVPGKTLRFDASKLKITNDADATQLLRRQYREGWEIQGLS